MSAHSALVGGSTAGRLLNCPGSHRAIAALPPAAEITSEYAEQGTALHEVMALIMRRAKAKPHLTHGDLRRFANTLVGKHFHDRDLSQEDCDTRIIPALTALERLEQRHSDPFPVEDYRVVGVEQKVTFPGVAGGYGTVDVILQNSRKVLHVDWKFGAGIGVRAVTKDEAGELVNPQLLFYAAAAFASFPKYYGKHRGLVLAIIQPAGAEPLTDVTVDRDELKQFQEDVEAAVKLALRPDAPRSRGEHCRFAPCKVSCPLWTGPLLDFTALGPRIPEQHAAPAQAPTNQPTDYGVFLSAAKTLADQAYLYKAEIDAQLHAYLTAGGVVPGWRLKPKAKQRQWVDEGVVAKKLYELGYKIDEIWQKKLLTFASAEAVARKLGVKIPDDLRVVPPSTETTIAREDDPAPAVTPQVSAEQFSAALNTLITTSKQETLK
jgi:hypothetical protein